MIDLLSNKKNKNIENDGTYCSVNLKKDYLSYTKISDQLSRLPLKNISKQKKNFFVTKYKFLKKIHFLKDLILMRTNKYVDYKIKKISKREIENFIEQQINSNHSIKVEKICNNFFRLSNEKH